jgi:hypothetical protein
MITSSYVYIRLVLRTQLAAINSALMFVVVVMMVVILPTVLFS